MHGPTCIFWANRTPFSLGAVVLEDKSILVVKSTNHFYGGFNEIAVDEAIYYVDTGIDFRSPYPSNPLQTAYTKLARLALDVKVILTPPCICHQSFSIQNIQGMLECL